MTKRSRRHHRPSPAAPPRGRPKRPAREVRATIDPDELGEALEYHTFSLPRGVLESLAAFYGLFMEGNRAINMSRLHTFDAIVSKHFVDALMVQRLLGTLPDTLMDVGTGAGFPGIPLKLLAPSMRLILVEGSRRRVEYLKGVREALGLDGVDIIGAKVTEEFAYPSPAIITRAFKDTARSLELLSGALPPGGLLYLMKGPKADDELAEAPLEAYGDISLVRDLDYLIPSTRFRRRLLVFRRGEGS